MSQRFPYGQVFPPEPSAADFLAGVAGHKQMCITSDLLPKLARVRPEVPKLTWLQDHPRRRFSGKTQHGTDTLSVFQYDRGWRAFRRFFDECREGIRYELCYVLCDNVALFPCSSSAIDAAEIFSFGQYWDVAPLVWVSRRGDYRSGEPELLLSSLRDRSLH